MVESRSRFVLAAGHPVFSGHFPGRPIVRGVMLLVWVLAEVARSAARATAALRLREAKFFLPLEPEQCAELQLQLGTTRATFDIRCETALIARGIVEWDGD
jgi:3-hydroxymyristoyl/3-hydroxydecanoyl-(acyl carrier protein) dehydratase